jgi:hypothetical protein
VRLGRRNLPIMGAALATGVVRLWIAAPIPDPVPTVNPRHWRNVDLATDAESDGTRAEPAFIIHPMEL